MFVANQAPSADYFSNKEPHKDFNCYNAVEGKLLQKYDDHESEYKP